MIVVFRSVVNGRNKLFKGYILNFFPCPSLVKYSVRLEKNRIVLEVGETKSGVHILLLKKLKITTNISVFRWKFACI